MPTRSSLAQRTSADNFGAGAFVVPAAGTFTPPDNCLLVVRASAISNNNDAFASTSLTILDSVGLTWTPRAAAPSQGWPKGVRIWTAPVATGQAMTVTVDAGAFSIYGYRVEVYAYTDYDTSQPVGATASGSDADGDGPLSLTLSASPLSTSEVIAAVAVGINSGTTHTVTPGTGWTELFDVPHVGWLTHQTQVRAGSASNLVEWADLYVGNGSAEAAIACAVEIRDVSAGGGGGGTLPPGVAKEGAPADLDLAFAVAERLVDAAPLAWAALYGAAGGATDLVAANIAHSHALDALALTQAHQIAQADIAHAQAVDAITLTQAHALSAGDAQHAHALDALGLAQVHQLANADVAHGHAADGNIVLDGAATLDPAAISHGHAADGIALAQTHALATDGVAHGHGLDVVALTQAHSLAHADVVHGHAVDALTLAQSFNLIAVDIGHGHAADGALPLAQAHALAHADIAHGHLLDVLGSIGGDLPQLPPPRPPLQHVGGSMAIHP